MRLIQTETMRPTDDGSAMLIQQDEKDCATLNGQLLRFDDGDGPFYDDCTKQHLPIQVVEAVRRKELDYFETKNVWKRVRLAEAQRISGRSPITVRWVKHSNGLLNFICKIQI